MIRTAKKMKQRTSNLPIGIGWAVKIGFAVAGFATWGVDFVWALLGLALFGHILKGIASFILSLVCLVGFIWFIFTHIF